MPDVTVYVQKNNGCDDECLKLSLDPEDPGGWNKIKMKCAAKLYSEDELMIIEGTMSNHNVAVGDAFTEMSLTACIY